MRRGVPFRKAHELVGKAVAVSVETGTPLDKLTPEQFKAISEEFGADAAEVFSLDRAFALRTNPGTPNHANTARRIQFWKQSLSQP